MNFADLVSQKIREKGPLAVGLDPHLELLPPYLLEKWFREKGKTLDALALCVAEFNHLVLRAVADVVGIVKIQMAFYEQLGVPGMVALKSTMNEVRNKGL
ncbi:MAG: orotidine 5'-phosphate decarboxylase, partial [Candidatus Atribacteria bacterium]|nr:orotidine 5'-phosphate decarboxylase [Candidatus Atribacteria bacterium]